MEERTFSAATWRGRPSGVGCMTGGYNDRPHHTEMLVSLNGSDAGGSACLGGSHWHLPPSR